MSYRTRLGGDLRAKDAGSRVTLAGWVATTRDHGGLVFVDLRDAGGVVQIVLDPADQPEAHATAHELRNEYVVQVEGVVEPRAADRINPKLATGQVEVRADRLTVLARAGVLPFQLDEDGVDESLRLHHRYLDLRRDRMRHNIWTRFKLTQTIRRHMEDNGFWELETPILYKSTPEGAREFVVPTSSHPGKFYALPQSPQTF
jgi:aspartyl-tRNA synthetase